MNPLALGSALLLLGAVLLPWMSLVTVALVGGLGFPVFGAQASLWDLAGPFAPIALSPMVPLPAGILLLASALAVLVRNRLGAILALVGVLWFVAGAGGVFGVHAVGSALTVVAPGPGVGWGVAGTVAAAFAYRVRPAPLRDLVGGLRSSHALARVGLFLAGTFLLIDAVDHASGGDLLAAFGSGIEEFGLHSIFLVATAVLAAAYFLRRPSFDSRVGSVLIAVAGVGLVLDAVYHGSTGDITDFIGHTQAEMLAHLATYYGVALLMISRFVLGSP